jgi:hypothetical protein
MKTLDLENGELAVELDAGRPMVLGYRVKPGGTRMDGARTEGALLLNGNAAPWAQWETSSSVDAERKAALYALRHSETGWELRFEFRLDGSSLVMTLEVVEDAAKTLKAVAFQDLFLIACPHAEYSYWRETWDQGAWNYFPPWPQPSCGCHHCTGWQKHPIRDAVLDTGPQPTVHACFFNDEVCGFVKTNYPYMPLMTQTLPSEKHAERAGSFGIQPNTYQYRVRDKLMPPLEARVVLLGDTNGDGRADECDYHLWLNRQYPAPEPIYRETVWYKVFNARRLGDVSTTYKQTLEIIEAVHHVTDHMPQMAYLVGWQYDGHDTGFPSYDKLNPVLGTREELLDLCRVAKERFDCVISYHSNVDDAYKQYPGWDDDLMCKDVDGELMPWMVFDERQSYHLCHTKDVESGKLFERMDAMMKLIPVEKTIHMDAFRHYNHSWDGDEFIGSMEELICGVRPILDYFNARGIDVSTESVDGWAVDTPGWFSGVWHLDDYWRAQITHGKIVGGGRYPALGGWGAGSAINRDLDYAMLQRDWTTILDFIYLGTMLYLFYIDREMVELRVPREKVYMRFADGVEVDLEAGKEHLEVTWGDVTVASGHDRFIPLRGAIYVYSRDGCERTWRLPKDWRGVPVEVFALSRSGRQPPPPHKLTDDDLWIKLPPRTPVKVMKTG